MSSPVSTRKDFAKLFFLFGMIGMLAGVFLFTPALSTPTLLAYLFTLFLSPLIAALERKGYPRVLSIMVVYVIIALLLTLIGYIATQSLVSEWQDFRSVLPTYYNQIIQRLGDLETHLVERFPLLEGFNLTQRMSILAEDTSAWFLKNGATAAGNFLSWSMIVPIFTFFFLKDGRDIKHWFFQLVPNRFFESIFMVLSKISQAVSDYLRAKLLEGVIIGSLTGIGLGLVGAPYAAVFALIAGVTNIIPYVGPVIGAAPALLVVATGGHSHLLIGVALVFLISNLIDILVIFPVIVAKLVNLNPLILLAAVIAGQNYYGFIGMLISIPIASALKVMINELYYWIYQSDIKNEGP